METSGFWQRTLDCAILLFILAVICLKVADIVRVLCVDWGQIFTVAGIFAFVAVLLSAVRNAFSGDDDLPTILDHTPAEVSSPKTGKGGGK
jgi:r1t holin